MFCLKFNGNVLCDPFIPGAVYIPCEGSHYHHNEIVDTLSEDLINFRVSLDLPVVLLADFNSRTGILNDFIELEDVVAFEGGFELARA